MEVKDFRAIEHGRGGARHSLHVRACDAEGAAMAYVERWDRTIIEDGRGSIKVRVYCQDGVWLRGVFTVTASNDDCISLNVDGKAIS